MNAVVLENVPVADLPKAWRDRLGPDLVDARVTVRIEQEAPADAFVTDDPAFGIWRDRDDLGDVQDYVRQMRAPRFSRDGSRKEQP